VTLFGCKKSRKPKLEGHWVSGGYFTNQRFLTLDFYKEQGMTAKGLDTIYQYVTFNQNSLNGHWEVNLIDYGSEYRFYIAEYSEHRLFFRNDSLILVGEHYNERFIKLNQPTLYKELFCNAAFAVRLPAKNEECSQSGFRLRSHLIIGYPEGMTRDSVYINVDDVFIELKEVPRFVREELSMLDEQDRNNLTVMLVADSTVQEEFLRSLVTRIRKEPQVNIRRVFYNYKTQQICFEKIEN
jgi:hypothetical protein